MRIKAQKISVTTSEARSEMATGAKELIIKNQGTVDCLLEFDVAITDNAYLLEAGESLTVESVAQHINYKTESGSTTLYVLKLF